MTGSRSSWSGSQFCLISLGSLVLLAALCSCDRSSRDSSRTRLRLSEVMPKSVSFGVTDEAGNTVRQGWVEVENPNGFPVALDPFSLSDSLDKPDKFLFPRGSTLGAHGFALVFLVNPEKCEGDCDKADFECRERAAAEADSAAAMEECDRSLESCLMNCSPVGPIAGFSLKSAGETIYLFANGALADSLVVKNVPPDFSSGRDPATGEYGIFYMPTPGAANYPIQWKPARFSRYPALVSTQAAVELPVRFTVDVDREKTGQGSSASQAFLDYGDLDACGGVLSGSAEAQLVDSREFTDDRTNLLGETIAIPVLSLTFEAKLPAGQCSAQREFRARFVDSWGQVEAPTTCFTYCENLTVVINEYQPRNHLYVFEYTKRNGEAAESTADWIEIRNYGTEPVDLSNLGLCSAGDINDQRFTRWLFGKEGHVTAPLEPGGLLLVLADNDEPDPGQPRHEYRWKGHDPQKIYYSTHFALSADKKPPKAYDEFSLVTSTGRILDRAVLDFSKSGYNLAPGKSAIRFGGDDVLPGALQPGKITDCPSPEAPNTIVCEVAPQFAESVGRAIEGGAFVPAAGASVVLLAQVNFDGDTPPQDVHVEFEYRVNGGAPTVLGGPPDLVVQVAQEQMKAAPACVLYDIRSIVPGLESGDVVVFGYRARDNRLQTDWVLHNEETPLPGETRLPRTSFRYKVGYTPPPDAPRINEVLPSNTDKLLPPFQNVPAEEVTHPDYAEIYNPSTKEVDLAGYYLSDSLALPTETLGPGEQLPRLWQFPGDRSTVPAGGFLSLYFGQPPASLSEDEKNRYLEVRGFNLDGCGETLRLVAPDDPERGANGLVDSFTWSLKLETGCKENVSVGRICDGEPSIVDLRDVTPGVSNVASLKPLLFLDSFHNLVLSNQYNACAAPDALVLVKAIALVDEKLGVSDARAVFYVDRGTGLGEEEFKDARISALCTDPQKPDCFVPQAGYDGLAAALTLSPPKGRAFGPVVRYRVVMTDGCGRQVEGGPSSFGTTQADHPQVIVSEINRSSPVESMGLPRPWIEIFNASTTEVDVSNMYLSDSLANPRKVILPPGTTILGRQALLLVTDGEALPPFVKVDLDWPRESGTLYLMDSFERGSCLVDVFSFDFGVALPLDASLGRKVDSSTIERIDPPSPGRPNTGEEPTFLRGDATGDLKVNITDMVRILLILFGGDSRRPQCTDALDANDDGKVDATDAVYVGNFIFRQGPVIPPPYPAPGGDPTPDELAPCGAGI